MNENMAEEMFECAVCGRDYPKDRPYTVPCGGMTGRLGLWGVRL